MAQVQKERQPKIHDEAAEVEAKDYRADFDIDDILDEIDDVLEASGCLLPLEE